LRRTVSALMIMLLLIGVSMLSFNVQRAKAEPNTIVVPDDFPTVQEAINAANHGDTIFIRSGNYHEDIVVNKSLSLIGENRQHTVLNGSGSGTALDITANNVNVTNLTIQNIGDPSAVGIRLRNVKHCNISGNNIVNSAWGMNHYYSSYNIISKNNIKDNGFGMELEHSNCTAIYENCITENAIGVWLEESVHNIIFLNSVINSSSWGVFLGFSSRNNTISRNILALNRDHAIHLMDSSNNNIVFENKIIANHYGVFVHASSYNRFYHNNFINNTGQVCIQNSMHNYWDNGYPSGGNYWSDFEGEDFYYGPYQNETGSDGILDNPYIIDANNIDRYPLQSPWPEVFYESWKTSFIGNSPVVDFAVFNGSLYATADNMIYVYNGDSWNAIYAPTFAVALESYRDRLFIGGKGGLYYFNGTNFKLIFSVPTYIKPLGLYNDTLYAGTILDRPPTLYYCNGSVENPDDWHIDTVFSTIFNFSGPFGSIDSFAVYNNNMYISSGGTVYCYNGTDWSIATRYDDVCAFLDMEVYNGKLYLATRDQAWRKPLYQGGTGFSGRIIEFDGDNWTTLFDHDYWIFSLETYGGKLYIGTTNKIYTYNGTDWAISFESTEGVYHTISLITYNGKIYAGMGNGYIFEDPSFSIIEPEIMTVPEFPLFFALPLFMVTALLAVIVYKRKD